MSDKDILKLMEPITYENIHELQPGEWIWDNRLTERKEHARSINPDNIIERTGFRQIHIIDLDSLRDHSKSLMLSRGAYYVWEYFEEGRFYKFKKPGSKVKVRKKTLGDVVKRLERDITELEN